MSILIKRVEGTTGETLDTEATINTTEPLTKIVKAFVKKERISSRSKALNYYRELLSKSPNIHVTLKHYKRVLHPLKHFKDDWDGMTSKEYFEQFQFRCTMPKFITKMHNMDKCDPVTDAMNLKKNWHNRNLCFKIAAQRKANTIDYENEEVILCPKLLIDLAARLESDPIPNFDAPYNWYYAGNGNMQLVCVECVDYLLHSEFTTVYLSRFHKENLKVEEEYSATFSCGENMHVLETICSAENIVAVRTEHAIFILKIVTKDSCLCFEQLNHFESESTFTGINFDIYHKYILYAVTLDSKLTIVNLNRMTGRSVKLKQNSDSLLNNWNCVTGVERCTYMFVERRVLSLYDKRTNGAVSVWRDLDMLVQLPDCNDINAAKHCEDSNSLYFVTDHHIFLLDTRFSKKNDLKAVQRWTHGLKCAPTYMSIVKENNNKDLVTISSQWCEDKCIISNYADSIFDLTGKRGMSIPYNPPNILDTMRAARLNEMCFDLKNPIDSRLATSITGQVVLRHGENFKILTQNSLGDIFAHNLYPKCMESSVQDDGIEQLHNWSKSFEMKRKIFEVSAIKDISHIWRNLKDIPDSYELVDTSNALKIPFDESKVFEVFEKQQVLPELLDAWVDKHSTAAAANQTSMMSNFYDEDSNDDDD